MICYLCGEETEGDLVEQGTPEDMEKPRIYCPSCSDKIRHADKHGIGQFEARFVE